MADYRLALTQRNEVFQMVEQLGLDPTGFQWVEAKGSWGDRIHSITHEPTGSFIVIDYMAAGVGSKYVLGFWPKTFPVLHQPNDWGTLLPFIYAWLRAVKSEAEAPDLWAMALQERAWLTSAETDIKTNTPFTTDEREHILRHLRTIEEFTIKTHSLTEAHQTHVRDQLRYLAEAASRVGRLDWKNLAASTFINIVVTLALNPSQAHQLLGLATELLGRFVVAAVKLLPS